MSKELVCADRIAEQPPAKSATAKNAQKTVARFFSLRLFTRLRTWDKPSVAPRRSVFGTSLLTLGYREWNPCWDRTGFCGFAKPRPEVNCAAEFRIVIPLKTDTHLRDAQPKKRKGLKMPKQNVGSVTMRVRVGDKEIEVTGPSAFVEKKIAEFLKQSSIGSIAATTSSTMTEQPVQESRNMSPAQFFRSTNPHTDNGRVLAATYFLEKFRNQQNATASEIKDVIAESRRNPPKNTSDAVNQNIRKGFLMTAGEKDNKLAFVLTSDGEAEVEEMLKSVKE
jgi:hypothetical protein